MAHTDKDLPWRIVFPDGCSRQEFFNARLGGDSGFRHARKFAKRRRNKNIRRFNKGLARNNGAKFPYSGLKRTWDFE